VFSKIMAGLDKLLSVPLLGPLVLAALGYVIFHLAKLAVLVPMLLKQLLVRISNRNATTATGVPGAASTTYAGSTSNRTSADSKRTSTSSAREAGLAGLIGGVVGGMFDKIIERFSRKTGPLGDKATRSSV